MSRTYNIIYIIWQKPRAAPRATSAIGARSRYQVVVYCYYSFVTIYWFKPNYRLVQGRNAIILYLSRAAEASYLDVETKQLLPYFNVEVRYFVGIEPNKLTDIATKTVCCKPSWYLNVELRIRIMLSKGLGNKQRWRHPLANITTTTTTTDNNTNNDNHT